MCGLRGLPVLVCASGEGARDRGWICNVILFYFLRYSSWRAGRERRVKLPITSSLWTQQTCLGEAIAISGNCGTSVLPGRRGRERGREGTGKSSDTSEGVCPALSHTEPGCSRVLGNRPSMSDRSNQDVASDTGHSGRVASGPWSQPRDRPAKKL